MIELSLRAKSETQRGSDLSSFWLLMKMAGMGKSQKNDFNLKITFINITKKKVLSALAHNSLKEQEALDSKKHLTVSKVSNFRGKGDIIEVIILNVLIDVLLCFGRFEESHEPGSERRHKDGQHPKVQKVPEMYHVLSWALFPDLLTL